MAFATEYTLTDKVSGALNAIDKALQPLPADMRAVEAELAKLNRASAVAAIDKTADPLKKRGMALKLQRADLAAQQKAIDAAAKLESNAVKKAKANADKEAKEAAKKKAADQKESEEGLGKLKGVLLGVSGAAAAAAAVVVALGTAVGIVALKAVELRKETERKLGFAFGGDNAVEATKLVRQLEDATGRTREQVVAGIVRIKNAGFTNQGAVNVFTLAEDARSASDEAADATIDAYTHIRESQLKMVNGTKQGIMSGADFDKLVATGAIDREMVIGELSAKYHKNHDQIVKMIDANMIRGDLGENALTRAMKARFDKDAMGNVGGQAKAVGAQTLDTQLSRIKNRASDLFSNLDTGGLVGIITKIGDFLDPQNPRILRFMSLLSDSFTLVGKVFTALTTGASAELFGKLFDFALTQFEKLIKFGGQMADIWSSKVAPALNKIADYLLPILDALVSADIGLVTTLFGALGDTLKGLAGSVDFVADKFHKLWNYLGLGAEIDANKMGAAVVQGFENGITSQLDSLGKTVENMADTVPDVTRDTLDQHSPSRVMHGIGRFTAAGFAQGIESYPVPRMPIPMVQSPPANTNGTPGSGGRSVGDISLVVNVYGASKEAGDAAAKQMHAVLVNALEETAYDVGAVA